MFLSLTYYILITFAYFLGVDVKPVDLYLDPAVLDKSDFDCVLCCRTLWRPVTTPCGHTYCQICLNRSLDYSSACPLCMKNLSEVS